MKTAASCSSPRPKPDAHWPDAPSPLQKHLADALNALPELEQATITLSLERIVALMEQDGHAAAAEPHADPASPILEVPTGGAPPESGLVV